jgi:transposase
LILALSLIALAVSLGALSLSLRAYRLARKDALDGEGTIHDKLARIMDATFDRMNEVMKAHGIKTRSWEYKLKRDGGVTVAESTIVVCPKCGRRNRLREGLGGARCASCKHALLDLRN